MIHETPTNSSLTNWVYKKTSEYIIFFKMIRDFNPMEENNNISSVDKHNDALHIEQRIHTLHIIPPRANQPKKEGNTCTIDWFAVINAIILPD